MKNEPLELVTYPINDDENRKITGLERTYQNNKYLVEEGSQKLRGITISKKLYEELLQEKVTYIQDLDNNGRFLKFYSPNFKGNEKDLTPKERGFYRGSSFKIKNGEIKKYRSTMPGLHYVDPYYGIWDSKSSSIEIYVEEED